MNDKTSVGVLVSWLYAGLLMWFDKCVELEDPWDNWRNPTRSVGGCPEHLPIRHGPQAKSSSSGKAMDFFAILPLASAQ